MSAPAAVLLVCALLAACGTAAAVVLMPPPQDVGAEREADGTRPALRPRTPWMRAGWSSGAPPRLEPPRADDAPGTDR
ncbi:unc-93 family MFS transporter [Kocuria palustris]|uniref:unc-93 family MFS transporter n=1 Tax=Kocuria palustris TaxID=71999 RepID=UPI0011A7D71A|nr:unc-93 family MFS transporter [Kocuria palustris]